MQICLLAFVLAAAPFFQNGKWTKTHVSDEITVRLPPDFYEMTPSDIAQRYPSVRKPIGAWTNEQRLVDISIKISATQWRYEDTIMAKEFFKASIVNLYDKVTFSRETVEEIDGKNFIVFEFDSRIEGEESLENRQAVVNYNYVMYLIKDGKTFVFTFQAPGRYREQWQPTAERFMHEVKVK